MYGPDEAIVATGITAETIQTRLCSCSLSLSYRLWDWILMWRIQSNHIAVTAFGYTKWQLRSLLVLQSPFISYYNFPGHSRNGHYQVFVSFYSPVIWAHEIRNTLSDIGIMVPLFYNLCKMCYNENLPIIVFQPPSLLVDNIICAYIRLCLSFTE